MHGEKLRAPGWHASQHLLDVLTNASHRPERRVELAGCPQAARRAGVNGSLRRGSTRAAGLAAAQAALEEAGEVKPKSVKKASKAKR